jgi:hypothetical protein
MKTKTKTVPPVEVEHAAHVREAWKSQHESNTLAAVAMRLELADPAIREQLNIDADDIAILRQVSYERGVEAQDEIERAQGILAR